MTKIDDQKMIEVSPLVTFALFAYNQEKYIREAVIGALSQTYSPLQIILSDDCSPDNTFKIMAEMVVAYSGPHQIVLNRNERNLGLASHVNHVMSLAEGVLIVVAAGDDISYPDRTSKLYDCYRDMDFPATIYSDMEDIDCDGRPWTGLTSQHSADEQSALDFISSPNIRGATCAYDREIFTEFSKLLPYVTAEDQTLPFRAFLLNRPPKKMFEKLIKYRREHIHSRGISNRAIKYFWQFWPVFASSKQQIIDLKDRECLDIQLVVAVYQKYKINQMIVELIQANNWVKFIIKSIASVFEIGPTKIIKAFIIKFGRLGIRESSLIKQCMDTIA